MMSLTRRHSASRGVRPARRRNERPRENAAARADGRGRVRALRQAQEGLVPARARRGRRRIRAHAVGDRARGVQGRVRLLQRARERGVPGARLQPRGRFHVGGPRGRRAFGTEARAPLRPARPDGRDRFRRRDAGFGCGPVRFVPASTRDARARLRHRHRLRERQEKYRVHEGVAGEGELHVPRAGERVAHHLARRRRVQLARQV